MAAALGVALGGLLSLPVQSQESPPTLTLSQIHAARANWVSNAANRQTLADGVYLYGQTAEPEQLGAAYLVFEVQNRRVVGAFYMPSSSFDCFYGEVEADRLALTVVDSYEQSHHPYSVALATDSSVASVGGSPSTPAELEGFHHIQTISDNDQRILSTCQADYREQV